MGSTRRALVIAAVVTCLVLGRVSVARAETQPEAAGILERMFRAYANAPAFSCEGSCDDREEGSALPPDHRTVTMRFLRPDHFRLTWTQKDFHGKSGTSMIYTKKGQVLLRQWGTARDEVQPSLGQAVDSCAGVSLGLSYLVPALLLGSPGYLNFVSLHQLPDADSEDGHPCWQLTGETSEGAHWELLIDRDTCALRGALETNILPAATAGAPTHTIRTVYRFQNVQFADTLPDSLFVDSESAAAGKKR